ncbi:hypothetical protein DFP72DRAFT_855074 [Ephemerocybe angulata]|uniref:Uncharacterized protein n=1 Tax=Ephemerocybe angulata TaxID=980116 RepID=A0A8H6HJ77_9AGAR|nr:hypothetical protein DFP72DRAFT_855074 [Tulosesus angulatus]
MTSSKSLKKSARSRRHLAPSSPAVSPGPYSTRRIRPSASPLQDVSHSSSCAANGSSIDPIVVPELAPSVESNESCVDSTGCAAVDDHEEDSSGSSTPVDDLAAESQLLEGSSGDTSKTSSTVSDPENLPRFCTLTDDDAAAFPSLSDVEKLTFLGKLSVEDIARLCDGGLISFDTVGEVLHERLHLSLEPFGLLRDDLLAMLKWTDGIITGSFVLALLFPGLVQNIEALDIFVSASFGTAAIAFFRRNGYVDAHSLHIWERNRKVTHYRTYPSKIYIGGRLPEEPVKELYQLSCPGRSEKIMLKYEQRGFQIWDSLHIEHECTVDARCPLHVRSLFDSHVVHFKWPQFKAEDGVSLRRQEADIALWRSGAALACDPTSSERYGFYLCNDHHRDYFFQLLEPVVFLLESMRVIADTYYNSISFFRVSCIWLLVVISSNPI